jgi:hypothetical protein
MAHFEPHLAAMWRSHHGCDPPHRRSGEAACEPAAEHPAGAAATASLPAGPAAQQLRLCLGAAAAGGSCSAAAAAVAPAAAAAAAAGSSVILGMLSSGFSWEQLCGNAFQMFFAGGWVGSRSSMIRGSDKDFNVEMDGGGLHACHVRRPLSHWQSLMMQFASQAPCLSLRARAGRGWRGE